MTFFDMISMSVGNLLRRKLRTFLTMLGVLIGTSSIVAMLSIGIGMQELVMAEYSSYGGITQIIVSEGMSDSGNTADDSIKLTDTNAESFAQIDHVTSVEPVLTFDLTMIQGKFMGWAQLKSVSAEYLAEKKVEKGELPQATGGSKLEVLAGNTVITNFYDPNNFEGTSYYMTQELPNVDLLGKVTKFTTWDQYAYERQKNESESDADTMGMVVDNEVRLNLKITGIMEGGPDAYTADSSYILVEMEQLKSYLTRNYKRGEIPNQPYNAKGKPFNEWVYNSIIVNVDDADNVELVQKELQDRGFMAQSNKEMLDSAQNIFRIIELVLGAIGMIAFLVAAIGIANTMMMSTYERTKEIGVMKVLGCDMRDIQKLFLSEAGFIGFLGGVLGLLFTLLLSVVANMFASQFLQQNMGVADARISVIPPWLILLSIVFSTLMGMLAGYFPARRAMKLSPLAAIRTE